ncbi:hypothetical protein [Psychromonas sp. MME1]|uniref:hypothetical protein n=1 Tax=Psychromonas sp. MME1 TaxID=3231032 RepID=UPI0034E2245B
MRNSHLLLSIPALFMAACSSPLPPKEEVQIAPTIIKEDFAQILEANFRGKLASTNGELIFTECDSKQTFSIRDNERLMDTYRQVSKTDLAPVYIEFTGEIVFSNPKTDESEPLIRLDRIHHMALAKNSLQCAKPVDNFRFKAKGDDPYWRININNQNIFFAVKASNQVYQVQSGNFRTTQINHIKALSDNGQRLDLTIEPGHCYDQKNGSYWGYIAKVDSVWGKYDGCGEPGWTTIEEKFTGYYLNQDDTKTTDLTINDNYSVEYKEKIGSNTIVSNGFWKSNSPDTIVVMLTKQDDKNIRKELIFNRKGLALTTQKINTNNIITPLPAPGLVFEKMSSAVEAPQQVYTIEREFIAQRIAPKSEIDTEVQQALIKYFKDHRTDPKNSKFSLVKYDLNGDGMDEAIVLLDWCSKSGCEMLIFNNTKNGYQFSSRVSRIETPIVIARMQHYRWQSLMVEKNGLWQILDFDGISYPTDARKLNNPGDRATQGTDVILFANGKPTVWYR